MYNPFGAAQQTPNRIIVHAMGEWIRADGKFVSAADYLLSLELSAHILVMPNGHLIRLRDDEQGAYHARGHNTNTLGIEFLVPGIHDYASFIAAIKHTYLTDEAYTAGMSQVRHWIQTHSIQSVARHSDIDPDRKQDPGAGFPWQQLLEDIIA